MTHRHHLPHVTRVLVACSPTYHNHRAIMEAIGSIFLDTIEEQREYYYFACPAMSEIFDDGALSPLSFRELAHEDPEIKQTLQNLKFTYVVAGGEDAFVEKLLSDVGGSGASLVRLA
ncbi:hypothetical protein [Hyphomicrobium sp.]|uniref:hypothetical protein n=1 Tax=Hyphomicrobium sp. TaxID=82 RepID=UPI000F929DDB|nr:hypothetical protein [Hyphomicrobium sp.]RUO99275.1 MAG: hypothetical protein EKK30_08605 [Hyphomicrobium sp.]